MGTGRIDIPNWDKDAGSGETTGGIAKTGKKHLVGSLNDGSNVQEDAKTFMQNCKILYSKELYDFEKASENDREIPDEDKKTIFEILTQEALDLLEYQRALPIGDVVVINKFLIKYYRQVVPSQGLHQLRKYFGTQVLSLTKDTISDAMTEFNRKGEEHCI